MKKLLAGALLVASCSSSPAEPAKVVTKPIGDEEQTEAFDFFYEVKNHMALGQYDHVAETAIYPMIVQVGDEPVTFSYAAELEAKFERVFPEDAITTFIAIDESELTFTEHGVKVADGVMWFDLICGDPACGTAEFRITELNPSS